MTDAITKRSTRRWLMLTALAGVVLLAAGCGNRDDGTPAHAKNNTARNDVVATARGHVEGEQGQSDSVDVAVAAFDVGLHAEEILTALISRDTTNGLDFASVSNAVAGIDSETIVRFARGHLESRRYDNPRTIAIAQLYEVVLARGDVPSARLVALLELHHMYGGLNAGRVPLKWFKKMDRLFEEARLSEQPTEAERTAFATIQVSMLTGDEEPEQKYARIQRIKGMCARGEINLSKQILDMMESTEIMSLLQMKRADEAYALMKESFAKRDRGELHPSVWPKEWYPEFESAFRSFSNSYYGDWLRQLSKQANERRRSNNSNAGATE